jgi:hypothetical protein
MVFLKIMCPVNMHLEETESMSFEGGASQWAMKVII